LASTPNIAAAAIGPPFSFTNIYSFFFFVFFYVYYFFFPLCGCPIGGVAQAQGLAGLTPGPALLSWDSLTQIRPKKKRKKKQH
jgi:membrane associated rhomboid family serine protease